MKWAPLCDLEIPVWRLGFLGFGARVHFPILIPRQSKLRLLTEHALSFLRAHS